ncbi:ROK family protein [Amaricoccus macauensis]|uniref:ROK family protein n=1 Tax=Amaricoccus macauensis TaxID=57001 RepID=UPI003C7CD6C8
MREEPDTAIGVDVGGTRIRVARIASDGTLLERVVEPVKSDREGFVAQLVELIAQLQDRGSVAIGIGIPGRVDGEAQHILSAGYLDIGGLDLVGRISKETGLPVRIENDATMALIAEGRVRPGAGDGLIFMITIGTGIGGAALLDGHPWYGGGLAGQFGHIVVSPDGSLCNCGRRGCVETFSSGTALGKLIAAAGFPQDTQAEDLISRAKSGNVEAETLLATWALPLQSAIATLVAVADPRLIVIGGGLGHEMTRALLRLPNRSSWFGLPIEAARLGDDAGVIGAGLAALSAYGRSSEGQRA